ncbi:MAG: MSMEG_4193 family putative phosphomutase [Chloroflexi bacterium]|nr:MAG: MSMEG_4193 family putative phosphomutase [Chloroflexota bacterium]
MTQLLLIRHAVNDWVGTNRLAGWTPGVHLNDEGRRQAEALAQRLADAELKAIYSSPLERTLETAEIIAQPHGLPVYIREGIGEARYGEWTGQKLEDLAKTELWPVIQFYPSGARFPGGEALREMQARAVAEIDAIRADHPEGMVAVVSHADVIKAIIAYYVGMHLDLFQRLAISPASLSVLVFSKMGPRLVRLNDTSHIPGADGHKQKKPARSNQLSPEDYL